MTKLYEMMEKLKKKYKCVNEIEYTYFIIKYFQYLVVSNNNKLYNNN